MANVLDLRRRIRSVKNTRQITKAMKMISAARLRRAQERALSSRPYARMISNVLESLVRRTEMLDENTGDVLHPALIEREEKNVLVVVIAGEKGFAGGFNANIIRAASAFISERRGKGQNIDIETVDARPRLSSVKNILPLCTRRRKSTTTTNSPFTARSFVTAAAPIEVAGDHSKMLQKVEIGEVNDLAHSIIERYTRTEIDSVYIVYNEFKSVIAQRVVVEKLLPIRKLGTPEITVAEEMSDEQREAAAHAAKSSGVSTGVPEESVIESEAKKFGTAEVDYIFDQSPTRILRHLMPKYITTQIFHALTESAAAEHAARMTAMDAATNNAGDMIDALSLTMNRVRQAAITKEIIEIVSGAAAL